MAQWFYEALLEKEMINLDDTSGAVSVDESGSALAKDVVGAGGVTVRDIG